MIIGRDFSESYRNFLRELAGQSDHEPGVKVEVSKINKQLQLDRDEIKDMLQYLEGRNFIKVETIGGPLLYGHISITSEGLNKIEGK